MYTVEVFTKKGTDSQKCKDHILATTGTVPGIHDNATHYVTHVKLTFEILEKLMILILSWGVMGVYKYSGLPSFDSKSFLVFILKTDSMAKISVSCSVSSGITPFLYLDTASLPILFGMTTNLINLSDSSI
jgi:hypothetical protein